MMRNSIALRSRRVEIGSRLSGARAHVAREPERRDSLPCLTLRLTGANSFMKQGLVA